MYARTLLAAAAVLASSAGAASAQAVSLEFRDGLVRLTAENAPVSRILAEWARLGGTTIVNGERIPGPPVTLQLMDVPERQALDIVLRGAAGYLAGTREEAVGGASVFDRVLVLPTTARAPSAPPPPPPPTRPVPQQIPLPQPLPEDFPDGGLDFGPFEPPEPIPLEQGPPGRVQPGLNLPTGMPMPIPTGEEPSPNVVPTPSNPFGVLPGSTRPGIVTPPPPNPNAPR